MKSLYLVSVIISLSLFNLEGRFASNVQLPKEQARSLIAKYVAGLTSLGIFVEEGRFGESMKIELVNDGPVTIVLDSDYLER